MNDILLDGLEQIRREMFSNAENWLSIRQAASKVNCSYDMFCRKWVEVYGRKYTKDRDEALAKYIKENLDAGVSEYTITDRLFIARVTAARIFYRVYGETVREYKKKVKHENHTRRYKTADVKT